MVEAVVLILRLAMLEASFVGLEYPKKVANRHQ